MAFTPQEQEIVQYGLKNGKSQEEVTQAIAQLRAGIKPTPAPAPIETPHPDLLKGFQNNPIAEYAKNLWGEYYKAATNIDSAVKGGVNDVIQHTNDANTKRDSGDLLGGLKDAGKVGLDYGRIGLRSAAQVLPAVFAPFTAIGETVIPKDKAGDNAGTGFAKDIGRGATSFAPLGLPGAIGGGIFGGVFHGLKLLENAVVTNPATKKFFEDNPHALQDFNDVLSVGMAIIGSKAIEHEKGGLNTPLDQIPGNIKKAFGITPAEGDTPALSWEKPLTKQQIQHDVGDIVGNDSFGLKAKNPEIAAKIENIQFPDQVKNTPEMVKIIQDNLTPDEFNVAIKDIYRTMQTRVQTEKLMADTKPQIPQAPSYTREQLFNAPDSLFKREVINIANTKVNADGGISEPELFAFSEYVKNADLKGVKTPAEAAKVLSEGLPDAATKIPLLESIDNGAKLVTNMKGADGAAYNIIEDMPKPQAESKVPPTAVEVPKVEMPKNNGIMQEVGRRVSNIFIRPTEKTAKMVQDFEAGTSRINPITPADTAARLGVWGTDRQMGVQATKELQTLNERIIPAVKAIKEPLKTKDLMVDLQKYVDSEKDLTRRASLQKALDKVKEDYKYKSGASYSNWQDVKSSIDQNTPQKAFTDNKTASAYKDVQHQLADNIRQRTYAKLQDQNIKQDYLDQSNLLKIKGEGAKAMAANLANRPSFTNLVGLAIDHSIQPITTGAGTLIYRAGDFNIASKVKLPKTVKTVGDFVKLQGKSVTPESLLKSGVIYLATQEEMDADAKKKK